MQNESPHIEHVLPNADGGATVAATPLDAASPFIHEKGLAFRRLDYSGSRENDSFGQGIVAARDSRGSIVSGGVTV
jgi:hypothetical protein